jgi:hypothetical protein
LDFAEHREGGKPEAAQTSERKGQVGTLAPWLGDEVHEDSPGSSSNGDKTEAESDALKATIRRTVFTYDSNMSVPRQRPDWEKEADEFGDIDDYHAMMRNI